MLVLYDEHSDEGKGSLKPSEPVHEEVATNQESCMSRKDQSRLLLKMDLCLMPTVALLYLFCFIDRANIGSSAAINLLIV